MSSYRRHPPVFRPEMYLLLVADSAKELTPLGVRRLHSFCGASWLRMREWLLNQDLAETAERETHLLRRCPNQDALRIHHR